MNDKALKDALDNTIGLLSKGSAAIDHRNSVLAQDIVETKVRAASLLSRIRRLFDDR